MRLAFFLTLLFPAVANAQAPKSGDLSVRFLAERSSKEIGSVQMTAGEVKSTPFELPTNHLSDPQAPPARAFSLRSVAKNVALSAITLPESGKSFIVLLLPAAEGYKTVVISAADPSFKPGDSYFYNHSNKTVLGYVGTAKFIIEPGKGQTLRPSGARPEKFYDVGFGVREKEGDRALSTTRWPVDANMRSYIFFYVNPTTKRVDFRAVDEFVPPEKPVP